MFASYVIYSIKQTSYKPIKGTPCLLVMLFIVLSKLNTNLGGYRMSLLVMLFIVLSKHLK